MSVNVTIAGTVYPYPTEGEEGWGSVASNWAVAVSAYLLQRTGGSFPLSAEVDFGGSFATKQIYLKSRTSNPSVTGVVRLARADFIGWRNQANGADLALAVDSSDNLTFNGNVIVPSTGVVPVASGGTGISSYAVGDQLYASGTTTLSKLTIGTANKVQVSTGTAPSWALLVNANIDAAAAIVYSKLSLTGGIVNADVNASAAIAYSKLALTGGIVNADINASAAIAYSKLNLTGGIVNADVNASAAIAYSKLNLALGIVNADVSASAAIARSKLASGTANHVVINDSGGAFSSEATLATSRGGLNIGSYTTGDIIYASSSSVLSKLAIGSSGQRLGVSGGIPSWTTPSASNYAVSAIKTSNYTALTTDDIIRCDCHSGAFTITLFTPVGNDGKALQIEQVGVISQYAVTISGTGLSTVVAFPGETLWIYSDGTNWQILNRFFPRTRVSSITQSRVTAAPTILGNYRSALRQASSLSYTETNGSPTTTPNSTDGFKIYHGLTYTSADTNNNPSRYNVFAGLNYVLQVEWYSGTGFAGLIDTHFFTDTDGVSDVGYVQGYDPTTGIVSLTGYISGSTRTSHSSGATWDGANGQVTRLGTTSAYFDIILLGRIGG